MIVSEHDAFRCGIHHRATFVCKTPGDVCIQLSVSYAILKPINSPSGVSAIYEEGKRVQITDAYLFQIHYVPGWATMHSSSGLPPSFRPVDSFYDVPLFEPVACALELAAHFNRKLLLVNPVRENLLRGGLVDGHAFRWYRVFLEIQAPPSVLPFRIFKSKEKAASPDALGMLDRKGVE